MGWTEPYVPLETVSLPRPHTVSRAVAIAEAQAICSTPCTAVAEAVASVPSVYECATGDANNATDAAKAQAPSLGTPNRQVNH